MIDYRPAALNDAPALAELGHASFVDAFGHLYSTENRIAERDGLMVGYCKIGFDITLEHDGKGRRVMELKQLYMRGNETGSGIGAALMTWALGEARARGFDDVILSVWSENYGAQRFYARHGFEKIGDTIFMVGNHRDEEHLMGLRLR